MKSSIIFLLLLPTLVFSTALQQTFEQANSAYKEKNYALAANMYDDIIKKGIVDEAVYYNAANAHLKNHELGLAILYYEKAKKIRSNEDIEVNLRIANLKTVDKIEALPQLAIVSWWNNICMALPADTWSIILITLTWLMAALIAVYLLLSNYKLVLQISILLATISLMFTGLIISRQQSLLQVKFGIIQPSNITIKSAPNDNSTDLFVLHEGVKVQLINEDSAWVNIKLSDGKVGWCKKTDAAVI